MLWLACAYSVDSRKPSGAKTELRSAAVHGAVLVFPNQPHNVLRIAPSEHLQHWSRTSGTRQPIATLFVNLPVVLIRSGWSNEPALINRKYPIDSEKSVL